MLGGNEIEMEGKKLTLIFIILPTIFVITGLLFFPYTPEWQEGLREQLIPIPLFLSLTLLFGGIVSRKDEIRSKLKMTGWGLFAFFWSTKINTLYWAEGEDFVNAAFCIIGVYVLFYLAYHEWLSIKRKENIECLNWAAGAATVAGFIYFTVELTPLAIWLREVVAMQSGWLLNLFTGDVSVEGIFIRHGTAVIRIIFACTAVQSMVLFVGMILPLKNVETKRKICGLLITIVPVYFLNLVRNALITYLVAVNGNEFFGMAHNVIGKGGSLIALVILIYIVAKMLPEVFDQIFAIADLPKRNGPLEKLIWRKK